MQSCSNLHKFYFGELMLPLALLYAGTKPFRIRPKCARKAAVYLLA